MNLNDNQPKTTMGKRAFVMMQMIDYWKACGFSDEKIEEMLQKMQEKLKESRHDHEHCGHAHHEHADGEDGENHGHACDEDVEHHKCGYGLSDETDFNSNGSSEEDSDGCRS